MVTQGKEASGLVIVTFVWSALCLGVGIRSAEACSCLPSRSPCSELQSGMTIFVGTPVSVAPGTSREGVRTVRFRFVVEERLAGEAASTVEIETQADTAACGFPFRVGEKYLVYGSRTARGLSVSFCSRTGALEDRRDDLALLKETAAGRPRARLTGSVVSLGLLLDGFYSHHDSHSGLAGVPITVRGRAGVSEARTDASGRFTVLGLQPGTYQLEPRLPPPYRTLFGAGESVVLDGCLGEATIFVAPVALSGRAHRIGGEPAGPKLMLRVARLDSAGGVSFPNTTLAFTETDGQFSFPGLPPGRYVLGVSTYDAPSPETPYPTTWYPNARQVADAIVIDVQNDRPQTIDFRLPQALTAVTIRGRVVDQNGEGLADASVLLFDDDDPHAVVSWTSHMAYARTDQTGRFSITGFGGRRYHAEATTGYASGERPMKSALVQVVMDSPTPTVTIPIPKR